MPDTIDELEKFKLVVFQYIDRKLAEKIGGQRRCDISLHGHFMGAAHGRLPNAPDWPGSVRPGYLMRG